MYIYIYIYIYEASARDIRLHDCWSFSVSGAQLHSLHFILAWMCGALGAIQSAMATECSISCGHFDASHAFKVNSEQTADTCKRSMYGEPVRQRTVRKLPTFLLVRRCDTMQRPGSEALGLKRGLNLGEF